MIQIQTIPAPSPIPQAADRAFAMRRRLARLMRRKDAIESRIADVRLRLIEAEVEAEAALRRIVDAKTQSPAWAVALMGCFR